MDIITGYTGSPHVTAEQDRDINIGIFGNESYVLQTGSQLTAEVSSNNEIKVRDGVIMHQGCAASIKKNTYDSLTITNGSQGMKRVDLIVARYSRDPSTNEESLTLKVIQGTPSENSPTVPGYTTGDIQSGDLVADMPLYQVILNGLNITEVKKLFSVQGSIAELSSKLTNTNTQLYETYVDPSTKSICIRFPKNRIQICAGTVHVYASLQKNGTGYTGVSTKIEQSTFPKPFKSLRGCTITQNSDDWVMILGKTTTLNGIPQLRLGYFAAYTNKAFYMDYIAIGTY